MGMTAAQLEQVFSVVAEKGIPTAAQSLSTMLGRPVRVEVPRITKVPITQVSEQIGGAEQLVVAVYLLALGDITGHILLILPHAGALRLVDMLLEQPEGTTTQLTPLEESALGEVGNVSASMLLNAIASVLGIEARPSPPAVIVDMAGAILDIVVGSVGQTQDEMILMETSFQGPDREVCVSLWLVPDPGMAMSDGGGAEHGV